MPQAPVGQNRPLRDEYNSLKRELAALDAQAKDIDSKLQNRGYASVDEQKAAAAQLKQIAENLRENASKFQALHDRSINANPYDPELADLSTKQSDFAYERYKRSDSLAKKADSVITEVEKQVKAKADEDAAKADQTAKAEAQQLAASEAGQAGEAPGNQQIDDNKSAGVEQTYTSPTEARLQNAGLAQGGDAGGNSGGNWNGGWGGTTVVFANQTGQAKAKLKDDWRVKVSLAPNSEIFYKSNNPGIMARLRATQGAIFPYTPEISVTHSARYAESKLTHSNYAAYFYEGSDVAAISIKGEYTVQTPDEGVYLLAVISFFRSCTKMFFGTQSQKLAGSPPPMVFLSGYGKYYFPDVPCVLTSFQHTMPSDCDYIDVVEDTTVWNQDVALSDGNMYKSEAAVLAQAVTRVPVMSSVSITLQPVYSRKTIHENFNLDRFASGELLTSKGGFI